MGHLLMTGVSGNVGVELLRVLLKDRREEQVRFVMRAESEPELAARWRTVLAAATNEVQPEDVPHLRPVRGDLLQPGLGLNQRDRQEMEAETTHILHVAALCRFSVRLREAIEVNVDGLGRVLELARGCRGLQAMGHVSTAYTAGRRQGRILEDDLEHDSGFVNAYEESKYRGELQARRAMSELPLSVYRLSLLTGREADGVAQRPGALHYFLARLYAGLCPIIPARPDGRLDLLPTDYAARIVWELFRNRFEAGRTYHVAAGDTAPTVAEWIDLSTRLFEESSRSWRSHSFVAPELVSAQTYGRLVDAIRVVREPKLSKTVQVVSGLSGYALSTKVFDRSRVDAALGQAWAPPPLESFYPQVIRHGIRTGWAVRSQGGSPCR